MIIKSSLNKKKISIKEIILKKNTLKSITTEKYLDIPEQPENTCPHIDWIKDINKDYINELKSLIKDCDHYGCSNSDHEICLEELERNNLQLNNFKDSLEDAISTLTEINETMERYRKDYQDLREYGN